MDITRARMFRALLVGAALVANLTNSSAATTEAHVEFGWLSAFQFDLSFGIDTSIDRSTIAHSGVDGTSPLFLTELDWVPLSSTRSSSQSFASSIVSAEFSNIDIGTDGGEAFGESAVSAVLSYIGLVPRTFDIHVPFSLSASTSVGGASAGADVFAELRLDDETSPFRSASASTSAEIIGTPNEKSGLLSLLSITFQPEQQMLLTISGLATVTSPPAPVPLPTPAILLASAVIGLIGIRRR